MLAYLPGAPPHALRASIVEFERLGPAAELLSEVACSLARTAWRSTSGRPRPLLHPAGFPQLYIYMLTQRRKVLRGGGGRVPSSGKLKAK